MLETNFKVSPIEPWTLAVCTQMVLFLSCSVVSNALPPQGIQHARLFEIGGQIIGASASAPVLLMNIQGWFPLGLTGLISLLSKGPSRVFSSITIRKHQLFGAQPSLWSNSHSHTWLLGTPQLWLDGPLSPKWCWYRLWSSISHSTVERDAKI